MIRRKFGHLIFSLILSFSFLFVPVFADDSYPISVLSLSDENQLGYGALVNTGLNEWDWFFDFVDGLNLENYQYIIRPDSSGYIDILYGNNPTWNGSTVTFQSFYECRSGSCSLNTTNAKTFSFPSNLILAMNLTQPTSGTLASYTNWNSVNSEQAYGYYLNSDPSQTTAEDILDAIIDGTDDSQNSADVADDSNEQLKDVIDEYDSIEQSYISDFNANLDNIDVDGFTWDSSFLTSASWVTTQFNELVMETPFENLITFSLIIGITLYLIGRYKG